MEFCITADELRKAIAEIEAAEKNGFVHCLGVFRFSQSGFMLSDNRAVYSDLLERAHPTNGAFDWGRFQSVSKRHTFRDGRLIPIESANAELTISRAPIAQSRGGRRPKRT